MRRLVIQERYTTRTDTVSSYFDEVNKYKLLSPDEEYEEIIKAKAGDQEAFDKVIKANLRFVISVAKMYSLGKNQRLFIDLVNEGNMGLITALHKFDPTTGYKLISLAVWYIRQKMTSFLSTHGRSMYVPSPKIRALGKIRDVSDTFLQHNFREPTLDEVADIISTKFNLHISPYELKATVAADTVASLSSPIGDDTLTLEETISSNNTTDSNLINDDLKTQLDLILSTLTPTLSDLLVRAYGIGRPQQSVEQLADHYGVSGQTIRMRLQKALKVSKKRLRTSNVLQKEFQHY